MRAYIDSTAKRLKKYCQVDCFILLSLSVVMYVVDIHYERRRDFDTQHT